jgi:8-oxo-dGTP diphosphatase
MRESKPEHRVALALVQRGDRWLVAKRAAHVHLGGAWEFPGGKLQAGEPVEQGAVRELLEECGVQAAPCGVLATVRCEYEDRVIFLTPVICRWEAGEPQALGNEACRWVSTAELTALCMPEINREIIRAALAWAFPAP